MSYTMTTTRAVSMSTQQKTLYKEHFAYVGALSLQYYYTFKARKIERSIIKGGYKSAFRRSNSY